MYFSQYQKFRRLFIGLLPSKYKIRNHLVASLIESWNFDDFLNHRCRRYDSARVTAARTQFPRYLQKAVGIAM